MIFELQANNFSACNIFQIKEASNDFRSSLLIFIEFRFLSTVAINRPNCSISSPVCSPLTPQAVPSWKVSSLAAEFLLGLINSFLLLVGTTAGEVLTLLSSKNFKTLFCRFNLIFSDASTFG